MSRELAGPRRLALVAGPPQRAAAAPPGVDPAAFAAAGLADTYEVLADLVGGAGPASSGRPRSPTCSGPVISGGRTDRSARSPSRLTADFDELVLVPADVPDLPGLVLAKLFKVLHRVDLAVAPERGGPGCVALGIALPVAAWLPGRWTSTVDPSPSCRPLAPQRDRCVLAPDWHRLRRPAAIHRLDPGSRAGRRPGRCCPAAPWPGG